MSAADQFWLGVIVLMASLVILMLGLCAFFKVAIWWMERRTPNMPTFPDLAVDEYAEADAAIEQVVADFRADLDRWGVDA